MSFRRSSKSAYGHFWIFMEIHISTMMNAATESKQKFISSEYEILKYKMHYKEHKM